MLPEKIAFVDIETTGTRIRYDRIIEIGIIRVELNQSTNTYVLTNTYQSLLNPQGYLPEEITQLTGITVKELETAPSFREIKKDLQEVLDNCIFVAHNARFDLGFLKNEFKRVGVTFSPRHFCTVKLSRTLYPQLPHHNLDSLIERFGFIITNRHRALPDALVLWQFFQQIQKDFPKDELTGSIQKALKRPTLPLKLAPTVLEYLPEQPGVYIFYGAEKIPLYIGKSINIKERVLSHFSNDHTSSIEMKISQQIERVEVTTTSGELGALLLESSLIKKLQPLYNRRLRSVKKLIILRKIKDSSDFLTVAKDSFENITPADLPEILGVFRSARSAKEFLIEKAKQFGLCEKLLGLENCRGACFGYRLGKCKGACIKKLSPKIYNLKFIIAFGNSSKTLSDKFISWPYDGPILVKESTMDETDAYVFDQWCHIATLKNGQVLNQTSKLQFDLDTYKILYSTLRSKKYLKKIRPLTRRDLKQFKLLTSEFTQYHIDAKEVGL